MSYARVYDFAISPGGTTFLEVPGDYYKIITSTGNIATRRDSSSILQPMFAGRGEKGAKFQRLALTDLSGSANTGTILIASDGAEMVDSTLQLVGAVAVRPEGASGNYKNKAVIVANASEMLFAAGTNTNGAILLEAGVNVYGGGAAPIAGFVAKATAPATPDDGDPIFVEGQTITNAGAGNAAAGKLQIAQYIPAGLGLYFICDTASASAGGSSWRHARWKML